jgi:hypothetical protein
MMRSLLLLTVTLSIVLAKAPAGPWDKYNLAPETRTIRPKSVYGKSGTVTEPQNLLSEKEFATLAAESLVTLDFGQEVRSPTCALYFQLSDASIYF